MEADEGDGELDVELLVGVEAPRRDTWRSWDRAELGGSSDLTVG